MKKLDGNGFSYSKSMANFEAFRWNFSLSTNPQIVRSDNLCMSLFRNKRFMLDEMT